MPRGSIDIFRERQQQSPTMLDVHLLVDASGSMSGDRACRAQDMAATLVDAFKRIPTVRVHVWQHNASSGTASVYRVYEPGMSLDGMTQMLNHIDGGNADGFALQAVGERAREPSGQTPSRWSSSSRRLAVSARGLVPPATSSTTARWSHSYSLEGCRCDGVAIAGDMPGTRADVR